MPKLIKAIFDDITTITDNGVSKRFSITQIIDAVHNAEISLARELNNRVKTDKSARDWMLPFAKRGTITMTGNVGPLPDDFLHEIDLYGTSGRIVIKEGDNYLRRRRTTGDPIDTISDRVNTGRIFNNSGKKLEIEQAVASVTIDYYRLPVKPVYSAPLTNGYPVYDDATSTDTEFSDGVHDILVMKACEILGVPIDKISVQRFGAKEEPKIMDY